MSASPQKFGQLLTEAVHRIRMRESNKLVSVVQDELGYALGKEGGSAIEYWRAGHIPAKPSDVELLAREIVRRSDVDRRWLEDFLHSADYPNTLELCDELSPDRVATPPDLPFSRLPGKAYRQLIGRDALAAEVLSALHDREVHWMVAIDGMGGMGKSAMALEVAHRCLSERIFDAAIWVSAAQGTESSLLTFETTLNAIGAQLGVPDLAKLPGSEKVVRVQALLRSRRVLVVLDNLDTAGEPQNQIIRQLSPLLEHSKALLTSRYRFRSDIYAIHLTGLDDSAAQGFIHQEAIEKNISRIKTAGADDLKQIVDVTGGSPLAMKLVVGQLGHLPLKTVLEHLSKAQPLRGQSDEDEYLRFFKFIFFPSWRLLSENGRKLLLMMAHFPAEVGGRHEAIQAISHMDDTVLDRSIDELWRLSFLEVGESSSVQQVRYYLHTLTQHFVRSDIAQIAS
jgi:hypothetical protein